VQKTIDGSFDLDQLKNTITTQEQLGFVKLTDIQKGASSPPTNVASFADDSSPTGPTQLVLIQLGPNDLISTISAVQLAKGRSLVFNSKILVSSVESQVVGFR
jgi:hypothetical protein